MDKKTASWVSYLTFIGGIIVLSTVKDDKEVRTHAWQSIFLSCAMAAVGIVLAILSGIFMWIAWGVVIVFSILSYLAYIGFIVISVICIIKATQDSIFKVPVIYTWAEKMK